LKKSHQTTESAGLPLRQGLRAWPRDSSWRYRLSTALPELLKEARQATDLKEARQATGLRGAWARTLSDGHPKKRAPRPSCFLRLRALKMLLEPQRIGSNRAWINALG
jgi:hypothetical protein